MKTTVVASLTKQASCDNELFRSVFWAQFLWTVKLDLNTESGSFQVICMVCEHWFINNRGPNIFIERKMNDLSR